MSTHDPNEPEQVDTLAVGLSRWHLSVARPAGQHARHVMFTVELVPEADMPPLTFPLSPADAHAIADALHHYADQAEQRDQGSQN